MEPNSESHSDVNVSDSELVKMAFGDEAQMQQ